MEDTEGWLRLTRAPQLSGSELPALLQRFGSPQRVVGAPHTALAEAGLSDAVTREIRTAAAADLDADLAWLAGERRFLVTFGDPTYPAMLRELRDAPVALFVAGDPEVLALPQLAIVGSRNPTPPGRDNAHAFASHLATHGLAITSGLALGIDAAAHRGALDADGVTIAVCACGLDRIYPESHEELAAEIAGRGGALVTEFAPGTPPLRHHFPHRNRLISGLALGTLVVEAAIQSGSLITARLAAEQGREVFAIPGSIHSPLARGCHRLIREGAKLVESAADIFAELGPLTAAIRAASDSEATDRKRISGGQLDKDYEILLDALGFEPAGVDVLVGRTGLKAGAVASMLLILELEGHVESFPGGLYIRTRSEAVK
jgi:DNA processing protein